MRGYTENGKDIEIGAVKPTTKEMFEYKMATSYSIATGMHSRGDYVKHFKNGNRSKKHRR